MKTNSRLVALLAALTFTASGQTQAPQQNLTNINNSAKPLWQSTRTGASQFRVSPRHYPSGNLTNSIVAQAKLRGNLSVQLPSRTALRTVLSTNITERGPHHRVVQSVFSETNQFGRMTVRTNSYTELATGMHYQENGQWQDSRELIEPVAGGAIARYGQHKVIFAENLNTAGVIDMETPDGNRLRSHVIGLSYRDTASGKNVLIAEVKDCRGQIIGSNQVMYADAFTGLKADVRYTYTKAGFEQDIILRTQPPSPKEYGLDPKTTSLQVFTEFLDPPQPGKVEQTLNTSKGVTVQDESLDFGDMQIGSGSPVDSDGDNIADFIEDRNGDGVAQTTESSWTSANTGDLAIVYPLSASTVSGIIQLGINLGGGGSTIQTVGPIIDGGICPRATGVQNPNLSSAQIEIDTRFLSDGTHTVSLEGYDLSQGQDGITIESQPVTITVANDIRFPAWHDRAELAVSVNLQTSVSPADYTVWFFNSSYPTDYDPFPVSSGQGLTGDGSVNFSDTPAHLLFATGDADPVIYSITELAPNSALDEVQGVAISNPNTYQDLPYPPVGLWVTAYADDPVDFYQTKNAPMADPIFATWWPLSWWHDIMFGLGWYPCGIESTGDTDSLTAFPSPAGNTPQTWPLRTHEAEVLKEHMDQRQLKIFLGGNLGAPLAERTSVRNFYGYGHGWGGMFLGIIASEYRDYIQNKRFRFVFLDGCLTASASGYIFEKGFNATSKELRTGKTHDELVAANPPLPGAQLTGPLQQSDYKVPDLQYPDRLGIKPGLFLGWRYTIYAGHTYFPQQVQDYWTGEWCYYDKYAAYAHWEQQLMYWWRDLGRDFLTAYNNAVVDAAIPNNSWPPWDITRPVARVNGSDILFHPDHCLVIFGYGNMHFNEFNHAGDPW